MPERETCKVIVMDFSYTYRKIAHDYFPKDNVVADRIQIVRLVNLQFLKNWGQFDEVGRRGLD